MVFKRRNAPSFLNKVREFLWPRAGWSRAMSYVSLRLKRLPGTPEHIARGIFSGVLAAFTPFYGLHFVTAYLLAKLTRGNVLAALLGTFIGNPLTYVPIAIVSLQTGNAILGSGLNQQNDHTIFTNFSNAGRDLWENFLAIFTNAKSDWSRLGDFYSEVFMPYLIGGIIPGIFTGLICYYVSVPLIRAYQKRRKGRLSAKLKEIRAKALNRTDGASNSD